MQRTTEKVRMAYLVMVHGRNVRQILRLVDRIYDDEDYFYIHVDSRSEYLYDSLKHLDKEIKCNVCEETFPTNGTLKSHKERVHINVILPCDKCDKTFRSRNALNTHVVRTHRK